MDQIELALEMLQRDNPLIELRPKMPRDGWWQGVYNDRDKLLASIRALNDLGAQVYWSFNRLSPSLTATNKLAPARKGGCVRNADVDRVRFIFLDFDALTSREAARDLAGGVEAHLSGLGWGAPILVSSGGGFYHFYECDLAASEAHVIKHLVRTLKAKFDTSDAIIDAKCTNVARIARVPGTFNRKGDNPVMACIMGVQSC